MIHFLFIYFFDSPFGDHNEISVFKIQFKLDNEKNILGF